MKRSVAVLLLILLLLLGVQRTPEAMDPSPIIGGVIIPLWRAGCVAATRTQQPTVPPTEEAPATIP